MSEKLAQRNYYGKALAELALVEMSGHLVLSHLLLRQAGECDDYVVPAQTYIKYAQAQNKAAAEFIRNSCCGDIDLYKAVLEAPVE